MTKLFFSMVIFSVISGFGVSPQAWAQPSRTTIRIANLEISPFLPVAYVAKLADKYNLDVKITNFRLGLQAAQALKSGEVDVAVGGVEAAISAIAGGMPAVIVSSVSTGGIAWVAQTDQPIKTVKDLKGKKFATLRGLHELVMRVEFEQNGLTMSTEPGKADVQVMYLNSPPALIATMKSKEVDAASAPEPFPSRVVTEKLAKPMLRPYDTPLGNLPRAVFMSKAFVNKEKDASQRFVTALVEATKTLRDNPKLAADFALNDALKGSMSSEDWALSATNMTYDVALTVPGVQAYIDYMFKYGMIKQKFSATEATDFSMLEKSKIQVRW